MCDIVDYTFRQKHHVHACTDSRHVCQTTLTQETRNAHRTCQHLLSGKTGKMWLMMEQQAPETVAWCTRRPNLPVCCQNRLLKLQSSHFSWLYHGTCTPWAPWILQATLFTHRLIHFSMIETENVEVLNDSLRFIISAFLNCLVTWFQYTKCYTQTTECNVDARKVCISHCHNVNL